MTEQAPFIEDVPSHAHDLIQAVLGTALSLALAAGLGGWLLQHQSGAGPAATVEAGRQEQAAVEAANRGRAPSSPAAAPLGDDGLPQGSTSAPWASEIRTLYIVASEQQAAEVRAEIEEANAIRANFGLRPLGDRTVMFGSAEEEVVFWLARAEEEGVRGAIGQPALRVVDLRVQDD